MPHRLTKITTRTGDGGTTGLGDGSRVPKNCARIATLGEIDELNCCIGLLLAEELPTDVRTVLTQVQHELFDIGGEISIPGTSLLAASQIARIEQQTQDWNANLQPLKEFILPGGTRQAALAHLCRTVCRRAERALVALAETEQVSDTSKQYLNRLSDLLFVLGRRLNQSVGTPDVLWRRQSDR
jgi:cob(I)alamin adenosyltransferase